jgi:anti-anti-sigma factor
MEIKTRQHQDVLIVDMTGRLDSSTTGSAHDAMVGIAKSRPKRVILNLDGLKYVTSSGLRAILTFSKLLQSSNSELKICNANSSVKELLQTSGFNSLLKVFDDEKSAIASWGST